MLNISSRLRVPDDKGALKEEEDLPPAAKGRRAICHCRVRREDLMQASQVLAFVLLVEKGRRPNEPRHPPLQYCSSTLE